MFSSTTIELSTTIPTANAMPARLTTFTERPSTNIIRNTPTTLIGIAAPTTNVLLTLRRNSSSTTIASAPPIRSDWRTRPIAL